MTKKLFVQAITKYLAGVVLLGLLILRDVLLLGLLLRVLWLIIVLVCHSRHLSSLLRRRYVSSNNDEGRILCEVKDSITHRRLHFMKEALKRKSNCTIGYTSHDGLSPRERVGQVSWVLLHR